MIFLLGLLSFYEIHDFSTLLSNNPTMQALKKKKKAVFSCGKGKLSMDLGLGNYREYSDSF